MNDLPLQKPHEIKLTGFDGKERHFVLSKIPATVSMEIVVQYGKGLLPGDSYALTEAMAFRIMSYVAVPHKDKDKPPVRLSSRELIDNHTDFRTYMALQRQMAEYNWGFFLSEQIDDFWDMLRVNLEASLTRIIKGSSASSSPKDTPPSEN